MSERCGIILHPAGHTLSPVLHREAYHELGLDADYEVFDIPARELSAKLGRLRAAGLRQLSVSLPHKEAALALADRTSKDAERIGAANTLTMIEGQLIADNTDWIGAMRALEPLGPWEGRLGLVLGAGGAARALVYALGRLGMEVAILNRTPGRAESLAADLGARVAAGGEAYDLLVNTTPVGLAPDTEHTPFPREALRPGVVVFDTVYRPIQTRLLREASELGCRTQDGLEMLVHQAVEQVRIWSGSSPSARRLREAAEKAM